MNEFKSNSDHERILSILENFLIKYFKIRRIKKITISGYNTDIIDGYKHRLSYSYIWH